MQKVQSWHEFHEFTNGPGDEDLQIFVSECFIFYQDLIFSGETIIRDLPFNLQEKTGNLKVQIYMCKKCGKLEVKINHGYPSRLCYCPKCKRIHDNELQRIRRARKQGKNMRFCEVCGKLLPDKYPNKKFCSGACRITAHRHKTLPWNWIENSDGSITQFLPMPDDPEIIEYVAKKIQKANERQKGRGKYKSRVKYGLAFSPFSLQDPSYEQ